MKMKSCKKCLFKRLCIVYNDTNEALIELQNTIENMLTYMEAKTPARSAASIVNSAADEVFAKIASLCTIYIETLPGDDDE